MWLAGHMPVSAATTVAVAEATGEPVIGLAAGMASHYLIDMGPWWTSWEPTRKQFYLAGVIDLLIGLAVTFVFFYWSRIPLVLLGGLVGVIPDLHKVPFLKPAFKTLPGRLFVAIHDKTHRWETTSLAVAVVSWAFYFFGGCLFLYLVCRHP